MPQLLIRCSIILTLVLCAAAFESPGALANPNPDVYTSGFFTAGGGFAACYPPAIPSNPNPATPIGYYAGSATTLVVPRGITANRIFNGYLVTDLANDAVDEWQVCPNGANNMAPVAQIIGPLTQLNSPVGVAIDISQHVIYVANNTTNSIAMFHLNANGNVAPFCLLQGVSTGLNQPEHIAIEPPVAGAHHVSFLYVVNQGNTSITVYRPRPCGNVAPIYRIRGALTQMVHPYGIDVYETLINPGGPAVYVADPSARKILEFSDTTGPANRAPFHTLGGPMSMLACPSDVRVSSLTEYIYQVDPCNMEISAFKNTTPFNTAPLYWYLAGSAPQFIDNPFGLWLSDRN